MLKSFDCSVVERTKAVAGTNDHCLIQPGMSYSGVCRQPGCSVRNQLVVCNRGGGHHLVNDDIITERLKCPLCRKSFDLQHIMLFACDATVVVHSTPEERTQFSAKGDDVVKIGVPVGTRLSENGGYLLSVDCKTSSGCAVM